MAFLGIMTNICILPLLKFFFNKITIKFDLQDGKTFGRSNADDTGPVGISMQSPSPQICSYYLQVLF